jgi:hypothetical protein
MAMAVSYAIGPAARIVRLTLVGDATLEQWTHGMRVILNSATYQPGFGFLIDRRGAEPATAEFMADVVSFLRGNERALAGARWAIVVPEGAGSVGAQFAVELADSTRLPIPIRTFREIAKAEAWLRETAPQQQEQAATQPKATAD